MQAPVIFYRYSGYWSWFSDRPHCRAHIVLEEYVTLRHTPKGAWILPRHFTTNKEAQERSKRFIRLGARVSYAYPTKEEAWESFVIRQQKRLQYAKNNLEGILTLIDKMQGRVVSEPQYEMLGDL